MSVLTPRVNAIETKSDGITVAGDATSPIHIDRTNGRVGIGTSSPASILTVDQGDAGNNNTGIRVQGDVGSTGSPNRFLNIYVDSSSGSSSLSAGSSGGVNNNLILQPSGGNVGIGTTSPSVKLEIQEPSGTTKSHVANTTDDGKVEIESVPGIGGYVNLFDNTNAQTVKFRSNGNSYFNSGNVGIGETSPTAKLHVEEPISSAAVPAAVFGRLQINGVRIMTFGNLVDDDFFGGIQRNGTTQAPVFFSGSDRRIKSNIQDSVPILDKIAQLELKSFNIADGSQEYGLIAQDVQTHFPHKVTATDDGTGVSLPEGVKPWTMVHDWDYELLKAVQELKAENDNLKTRIEALENV